MDPKPAPTLCDICDRALVADECPECSRPWDECLFGQWVDADEDPDADVALLAAADWLERQRD